MSGFTNDIFSAIEMVTERITISNDPVQPTDGANKLYVDNTVGGGFNYEPATSCATTVNLTATYNNGTAGVGATLTNSGTLAAFSVDGITPPVASRVLVKNQTTNPDNGIYDVTTAGDGATPWVLTRSTNYDEPSEIIPGSLVPVTSGTTNGNTFWLQTEVVTTVGTDPIIFVQFGSQPIIVEEFAILAGGANNQIESISPSVTQGIPVVSKGPSALPAFDTVLVVGGGTGSTSFTNVNSIVISGATPTDPLVSVASGAASTVWTSNGPSVPPTWQPSSGGAAVEVVIQKLLVSGRYTPTTGMKYCIIEMEGAGGAGGGSLSGAPGPFNGSGGGAGGYARSVKSAAYIGAGVDFTVGVGGTPTINDGNPGGDTFIADNSIIARGGQGGVIPPTSGTGPGPTGIGIAPGGAGGSATGDIACAGGDGEPITNNWAASSRSNGGNGGASFFGGGGRGATYRGNGGQNGFPGLAYGSGGGGGARGSTVIGSGNTGGAGGNGIVIITEFI